jgi:hypothetical protein
MTCPLQGYYNTSQRDGYLPVFKALQALGVGLHLGLAEARAADRPASVSDVV